MDERFLVAVAFLSLSCASLRSLSRLPTQNLPPPLLLLSPPLPSLPHRNSINYIAETDRVYLAVADKAMNTRIIFAFLEKIRGRYAGENGSSFNAVLGEQMVRAILTP